MKNRMGKWLLPLMLFAAACLFGGCGKMTPEKLAVEVVKNSKDIQSMQSDMELDFGGKASAEAFGADMSMDLSMKMDVDMQVTTEPELASHLAGTMELSMLTMNFSVDLESYTVPENGGYTTYTKVEDAWTKMETDASARTVEGIDQSEIFSLIGNGGIEAELLEDPGEVNGKETYVMNAALDGDVLESLLSLSRQALGEDEELELDGVTADAQIQVYKKEMRLAQITLDCVAMGNAIFGEAGIGDNVEVDHFDLTLTVDSWNDVEPIQVSEEARSASESAPNEIGDLFGGDDSDGLGDLFGGDYELEEARENEDGTYTIFNYAHSASATIGIPEGFAYAYSSPNALSIDRYLEAENLDCTYSFEEFSSMDEMAAEYGDFSYIDESEEAYSEVAVKDETTIQLQGMEVHYAAVAYYYASEYPCVDCYAWTESPGGRPFLLEIHYMGDKNRAEFTLEDVIAELIGEVRLAEEKGA